jgi:hypothetical protein
MSRIVRRVSALHFAISISRSGLNIGFALLFALRLEGSTSVLVWSPRLAAEEQK